MDKEMLSIEWVLDNVMPEEPGYSEAGEDCDLCAGEEDCLARYDAAEAEGRCRDAWTATLAHKRFDPQYEYVVESLRRFGQLEPSGYFKHSAKGYFHGDGHHRLAAAIDLGWTEMWYEPCNPYGAYREDSGSENPRRWTLEFHGTPVGQLL